MSNLISDNWLFTTVGIEDDTGAPCGTGFLVGDTEPIEAEYGHLEPSFDTCHSRAYVVTARHVLGANKSEVESTLHYTIVVNAKCEAGLEAYRIQFDLKNDPRNWALHSDPTIDVAVLDVTQVLAQIAHAKRAFAPLSEIANPVSLLDVHCEAGDDVFVLGYPLTLRQGRTNLPIVRKGVLASSPCRPLEEKDGRPLRGFLVDGAVMPGSSGSPVISTSSRFSPGDLAFTPNRSLVLGVVVQEWGRSASARYDAITDANTARIEGYANLGFAQSASTIIETIAELGYHTARDFLALDHHLRWAPQLGVPECGLEFDGREVDSSTAHYIMRRLDRDRMRAAGVPVKTDPLLDAIAIMGPPKAPNVASPGQKLRASKDVVPKRMKPT
jgi:hypothetical protein